MSFSNERLNRLCSEEQGERGFLKIAPPTRFLGGFGKKKKKEKNPVDALVVQKL